MGPQARRDANRCRLWRCFRLSSAAPVCSDPARLSAPSISLAVVTGATGHVGNTLVRHLLEKKIPVRVLVRGDATALEGLQVEQVKGDVTDPASLNAAFAGADVVFHVAGLVSITTGNEAALEQINVEGTRNVVAACRAAKVRRLVYTSSVHALTEPTGSVAVLDEAAGFDPALAHGAYGKSKAAASRCVQEAARAGELDAVLVLPTGCVGPCDFRFSELGNLVARVGKGRMPIIIGGGYEWVDVRDVAAGTLAAAERGRTGEAYLLNGSRLSTVDLCAAIARAAGQRPPAICLPLWIGRAVAVFGPPWERLTGRRALVTPYAIHTLSAKFTVSSDKARRELGLTTRPVEQSLADAWEWLNSHPKSPMLRSLKVGPGRSVQA